MRKGVLSDNYLLEHCKEFRPLPMDKAVKLLKIDLPINKYPGIKPIYHQIVARPETISTMVANVHRANQKAGDVTSNYEEILGKVVGDLSSDDEFDPDVVEALLSLSSVDVEDIQFNRNVDLANVDVDFDVIDAMLESAVESAVESAEDFATPEKLIPASSSGRGGKREGGGRMTVGQSYMKKEIEDKLQMKESIKKKDISEAVRYSRGNLDDAIERVVTTKKEENVNNIMEGILKRVQTQVEANEKAKLKST